jgi:NAD(P)-dependent dehydrogenase (short-subunit alcohol dehydrogenase family)
MPATATLQASLERRKTPVSKGTKVILVTGGSRGLGRAFCERFALEGHHVTGTSRAPLFEPEGWDLITLDVREDESVQAVVDRVIATYGRIDVLVNNAGVGIQGAVEDIDMNMAMDAFQTNFFGLHRMCRAVLPFMRKRKSGLIINISSIVANYGMPFRAFYSASKAAVDRYSETMRMEVKPFGIDVVVVEPGGYKTGIAQHRIRPSHITDDYGAGYNRSMAMLDHDNVYCREPEECAAHLSRIVASSSPATIYRPAQAMAKMSVLMKRLLPERLFETMLWKHYG